MSTNLRFPVRLIASLFLIVAAVCASPGAMDSSQVKASNGPVNIYLPMLDKPAVVTAFGAFLDAGGMNNGLAQMSAASASWVRIPFYWSDIEASVGQRTWQNVAGLESELKAVSISYMNTILYINDTPKWALKAGYSCGAVAQDKFEDLAHFLTDLVKRYSVPPFNVKYYELWNEPDVAGALGCWGDFGDTTFFGGGYYGEMLKVAYPAIKAADPQAQVLFGGLLMDCNADSIGTCLVNHTQAVNLSIARFFDGALADGAAPYFDGVSFHGYDYYEPGLGQYYNANWATSWDTTGPVAPVKAAYLQNALARYNVTGKYLMNTELAILCGRDGTEAPCVTHDHEQTVSAYIVQGMAASKADGLIANIWFSVGGWRGSGLLDSSLNPLPSYNAYKVARVKLGEAVFVRAVTEFSGVKGYEFTNNGRHLWVLWSMTTTDNTLTLGTTPAAVYDIYGNAMPVSTSLDVGLMPVYVEFNN
jgi:hypothetical protein